MRSHSRQPVPETHRRCKEFASAIQWRLALQHMLKRNLPYALHAPETVAMLALTLESHNCTVHRLMHVACYASPTVEPKCISCTCAIFRARTPTFLPLRISVRLNRVPARPTFMAHHLEVDGHQPAYMTHHLEVHGHAAQRKFRPHFVFPNTICCSSGWQLKRTPSMICT